MNQVPIYKASSTQPATPTGDCVPEGWSSFPPSADPRSIWVSSAYQDDAGLTREPGWAEPAMIVYGAGETPELIVGEGDLERLVAAAAKHGMSLTFYPATDEATPPPSEGENN